MAALLRARRGLPALQLQAGFTAGDAPSAQQPPGFSCKHPQKCPPPHSSFIQTEPGRELRYGYRAQQRQVPATGERAACTVQKHKERTGELRLSPSLAGAKGHYHAWLGQARSWRASSRERPPRLATRGTGGKRSCQQPALGEKDRALSPGQARNQPLAGPASAWKWFPTSRLKSRIGGITSPISQVQLPPPHRLQPLLTTSAKLKETISRQCPSAKLPGEWASGAKGLHIAEPCPSSPQPCSHSLRQGHTAEMRAGGKLCLPFWLSSEQLLSPRTFVLRGALGRQGWGEDRDEQQAECERFLPV